MLQLYPVYLLCNRCKTLTGSPDPTYMQPTNKPCICTKFEFEPMADPAFRKWGRQPIILPKFFEKYMENGTKLHRDGMAWGLVALCP